MTDIECFAVNEERKQVLHIIDEAGSIPEAVFDTAVGMTDAEFFAELDSIFRDLLSRQEPLGDEFEQAWDGNQEGLYIDSADGK